MPKEFLYGLMVLSGFLIRDIQVKNNFEQVSSSLKTISDNQKGFAKVDSAIVKMITTLHK
jgi:hypothetical protein